MDSKSPSSEHRNQVPPVYAILVTLLLSLVVEVVLGSIHSNSVSSGIDHSSLSRIARIILTFLGVYIIHRFALVSLNSYSPRIRDFLTLSAILIGTVLMICLGQVLSIGLTKYLETTSVTSTIRESSLYFSIPFASGALLLQAILGLHYGLVFSVALSLIVSIYFPAQPFLVLYSLTSCLVAVLSLSRFRSRSAFLKAGFNISLVGFIIALGSIGLDPSLELLDIVLPLLGAIMGGILCAFVASGVSPIVEAMGGYVNDMRLLEMATLDHPLLKELSVQAPGTWNHSMVIGMMVETAAEAVDANAVLARVGAYFHDIGKTKKPLYFVENQAIGENRHDKLSSSMSALIIRSHVKDGIELARKHKLPQVIIDMIPQHHGTSTIEFFYEKAKKEAKDAGEDPAQVDRSLYSYPGPKPQTKEAGILMLADGIEAAARTLSDPSYDRIQGMVQNMINKVFASGELNECDLTLRDLHLIAKQFTRILTSIYHQRIAYAEPAEKVQADKGIEKAAEKPTERAGEKGRDTLSPDTSSQSSPAGANAQSGSNGKSQQKTNDNREQPLPLTPSEPVSPSANTSANLSPESSPSQNEADESEKEKAKKENREDLKRLGI